MLSLKDRVAILLIIDIFICCLQKLIGEVFNIVSQQSTARPGCIIELDAITDQVKTCFQIGDVLCSLILFIPQCFLCIYFRMILIW